MAFANRTRFFLMMACLATLMSGCSSPRYDSAQTPGLSDPIEEINRKVFAFNQVVDDVVIHPIIDGYRFVVPAPVRAGVDNALSNLQSPVSFANELMQGDVDGAGKVLFRAIVNSFVGFGGLFDFAGAEGYNADVEDFGQTLAVWGVKDGPYIVMPFFGPSSLRDFAGYAVDSFIDPVRISAHDAENDYISYNKSIASYLNVRNKLKDGLEELEASSIDYYASVRSSYYQARQKVISDSAASVAEQNLSAVAYPEYDDF